jgi:hypothetical protein
VVWAPLLLPTNQDGTPYLPDMLLPLLLLRSRACSDQIRDCMPQ